MQIYLLRHGIAEEAAPGKPDSARALTAEGKKKTRAMLKTVQQAGVKIGLIITSPYKRAMETAQLAAAGLEYQGELTKSNALLPHAHPREAWQELRVKKDHSSILLVGHEPHMSGLVSYLLAAPELQVDFKKAAVCRIDVDQFGAHPHGVLKWLLTMKLAG
jgi:phosphohistidine phosphatase